MTARVLVMAKAPVPGQAKTRLGAGIGMEAAAELAAAALLDTLEACSGFEQRYLALTGDLQEACRGAEIAAALSGWTVFDQQGSTFGERLAHAHTRVATAGQGAVVQIGMDTPQVTPVLLASVSDALDQGADVVLGPAEDGGWWVLGLADPRRARALVDVAMSVPETYAETVIALQDDDAAFAVVEELRDVDTAADAAAVARDAPATRFAQSWGTRSVAAS